MDRDHLDPEIVAAWLDGSLDARSRADAEAHVADCARCQAVLAAMIRTEPPPSAKPWLSGSTLRWLVPLTAAASAIAIWVAVTPQKTPEQAIAPPAASVEAAPPIARAEESAQARAQSNEPSKLTADRGAPAPAAPADLQAPAKRERAEPKAAVGQLAGGGAAIPESVTPQAGPPAALAAPPPPPPAPAAPPSPPAAAPLDTITATPAEARGVVARKIAVSAFAARREIRTPDRAVQWRIDPPAHLWRSADGGKTWTPQNSGVTTELLAGSAPSANAVWIVGRGGVVLLSTDGESWRRVAFPERVDLTEVTATDARSAVVTTLDGRRYVTTDGGANWRVQEK